MAADLSNLIRALEVGSGSHPGSLVGGAPLQVEDLEVTMKLVTFTFTFPYHVTEAKFNRFLRNLNIRHIEYTLETRNTQEFGRWNRKLTVSGREMIFHVLEIK